MFSPIFWLGVSMGVATAGLALALLARARSRPAAGAHGSDVPPADEALPGTWLQTRAIFGLVIGTLSTAVATILVVREDPSKFLTNDRLRMLVYGVFAAGALAYGLVSLLTRRAYRGEVLLDERDREILAAAPRIQAIAILVTLLIWAVALTESYWEAGAVPIAFPFLIFVSSAVAGLLAFSAGIVLGYRRA